MSKSTPPEVEIRARELLNAELAEIRRKPFHYAGTERDQWNDLYDAAVHVIAALTPQDDVVETLRKALEQWKCPSCGGSKVYTQRGRDETAEVQTREVPCKVCGETGLHPIARDAIERGEHLEAIRVGGGM